MLKIIYIINSDIYEHHFNGGHILKVETLFKYLVEYLK